MEYRFGGLGLDADFGFGDLDGAGDRPPRRRVRIARATGAPPDAAIVHRGGGRYRLTSGIARGTAGDRWVFRSIFPDVFVFSPDRGHIACHVASDDARAWRDVLLRRVLPRAAVLYGAATVHAATVALGDRCLMLIGRSGAGKSTLTAFCAGAGWDVLSDDASILWIDDPIVAEPVQHGVGVWGATRAALALPPARCLPMPGYDGDGRDGGKWCFRPPRPAGARTGPRPLRPLSLNWVGFAPSVKAATS